MYAGTIEINKEVIPNLSFSLKPTAEGHNLAGVTDGGYELRSRGPASQGFEALDNLVSEKCLQVMYYPYCSCCWELGIKVGSTGFTFLIFQSYWRKLTLLL